MYRFLHVIDTKTTPRPDVDDVRQRAKEVNMLTRKFGRTGRQVSEIGYGSWAICGLQWGHVEDDEAIAAVHAALGARQCQADDLSSLSAKTMAKLQEIYAEDVKPYVHQRW
jgi:hypothetical protein